MNKIIAIIFGLAFVSSAQAAAIGIDTNLSVDTDVNVKKVVSASSSVGVSANASATGTLMKKENSKSGDDKSGGKANATSTGTSTSSSGTSTVSVEAKEIRGWSDQEKSDFLSTVKAQAELKSGQDLQNFAKGVLASDENVEEVSSTDTDVEVTYKLPAKFLGVFKTTIEATTNVTFNGKTSSESEEVKVKFPWYRLFYSLSTDAQSDVIENAINANIDAEASSTVNVYTRNGKTIQLISDLLKEIRLAVE